MDLPRANVFADIINTLQMCLKVSAMESYPFVALYTVYVEMYKINYKLKLCSSYLVVGP